MITELLHWNNLTHDWYLSDNHDAGGLPRYPKSAIRGHLGCSVLCHRQCEYLNTAYLLLFFVYPLLFRNMPSLVRKSQNCSSAYSRNSRATRKSDILGLKRFIHYADFSLWLLGSMEYLSINQQICSDCHSVADTITITCAMHPA